MLNNNVVFTEGRTLQHCLVTDILILSSLKAMQQSIVTPRLFTLKGHDNHLLLGLVVIKSKLDRCINS